MNKLNNVCIWFLNQKRPLKASNEFNGKIMELLGKIGKRIFFVLTTKKIHYKEDIIFRAALPCLDDDFILTDD